MSQEKQIWQAVTEKIRQDPNISAVVIGQFGLVAAREIKNGVLHLEAQHAHTASLLEIRYHEPISAALKEIPEAAGITDFTVVVNPDFDPASINEYVTTISSQEHENTVEAPKKEVDDQRRLITGFETQSNETNHDLHLYLNERFHFKYFVIGPSNRISHAAAVAVAEAPAKAYNPLFIYGDSGLGKTHLMHAIGLYAKELNPKYKIIYVNAEDFTNEFINAVANNSVPKLQEKYRTVDFLLIDDIQFLSNKTETQEAFFHIFNTLHNHNKQVVLTSDVQPNQLVGFEARMMSRFVSGLQTDITAPNLETRIAILRRKAQYENLEIADEILDFIASRFTSNVRELEGMLNIVAAYASLAKEEITLELTKQALKGQISAAEIDLIKPEKIIEETAAAFEISLDDIYGQTRSRPIALSRQTAMYLVRELTDLSLPEIGRLFGGRDHTTVMHAHKRILEQMKQNHGLYTKIQELTTKLKG